MINQIKSLFQQYNYRHLTVDNGHLFCGAKPRQEFWYLMDWDGDAPILEAQAKIFKACSEVEKDPAFEKNTSMLLLWETNGTLSLPILKQKIMQIEEDPYFFKKYVLHYSTQQKTALLLTMDEMNLKDFLIKEIPNQETFQEYKNEKIGDANVTLTWQSFLYRIAIKIPFLKIDIDSKNDLGSLFRDNNDVIASSNKPNIINLNQRFFDIGNIHELLIAENDPQNLLDVLTEQNHANKN